MNKDEHIIELAMRFAIAIRTPGLFAKDSNMLMIDPSHYSDIERTLDRNIARYCAEMATIYVEAVYRHNQERMLRQRTEVHQDSSSAPRPPEGSGESKPLEWHGEMQKTVKALHRKPDIEAP